MADVYVNPFITIPEHELLITTSRAGGPGGQHVNKTETKITVRWNIIKSAALDETLKARVLKNLQSELTAEGDLIIHNSESRSQQHNKERALSRLAEKVRKALFVPKKRIKTKVSKGVKEKRYESKKRRGEVKRGRSGSWE
jgi:ribosome-associated protein